MQETQEMQVWSLGQEKSPGGGGATHSCILAQKNPVDQEAWWAVIHGVTKSWTQVSMKDWRQEAGEEGDDRGQWIWVWTSSGRWWKTSKPGVLQPMGVTKSQTRLSDWTTDIYVYIYVCIYKYIWKWKALSRVRLFVTPWTTQFMEFSSLEYWSG